MSMRLWLDDERPAPAGWHLVKTIEEAKALLITGKVVEASLDHDLGACTACMRGLTPQQWLAETKYRAKPNCEHFGTGYQLVRWMEETGNWPQHKPSVHSANMAGSEKMQAIIDRHFG
jgi:hypothetical protein